jgi:hypothetical protein
MTVAHHPTRTALAALALTALAACASAPDTAAPRPREELEYITGSNIPRRHPVRDQATPTSAEDLRATGTSPAGTRN